MKNLIAILSVSLLTACASKPTIEYVTKYQVVTPDSSQVKNCKVSTPQFNREKYIYSIYSEKEKMLYEFSNSLLTDISICNSQWEELRKWFTLQESLYNTKEVKK